MFRLLIMCLAAIGLFFSSNVMADSATPLSSLAKMPIKEVSVFKDGYVFVLHEGNMPTNSAGDVQIDYLPTPVIGTFWPYSSDPAAKLAAVTAKRRRVLVERTSLTTFDMLISNVGADVTVETNDKQSYAGKILGVPTRSSEENDATSPPNTDDTLPQRSNLLLLKTDNGTIVLPAESITWVTFKGVMRPKSASEEFRNLLTIKLNWKGAHAKSAKVGIVYLQKGIRWIPSYKVSLDGKGAANVQLQATLVNELADLDDVTANLVIGVPTFAFKDQIDPISLQQTAVQLSESFRSEGRQAYAFSNAIQSQMVMDSAAAPQPVENPAVAGGEKNEDLFVFTVKHLTLKKGERLVMPIASFTLKYRDIYTMDVPFAPPLEVRTRFNNGQDSQLAAMLSAPKFMHKIRLINSEKTPLTTAPALILDGDKVLAQGMMTYASPGSECDLNLTTAIDIKVKKTDKEVDRIPNAIVWQGEQYGKVNCAGTLTISNYRDVPVQIQVTRSVLGIVDKADHAGKPEMVNVFEDGKFAQDSSYYPAWWGWYNWPSWWYHFNGVGRISWEMKLDPGQKVDLGYSWHYFWR